MLDELTSLQALFGLALYWIVHYMLQCSSDAAYASLGVSSLDFGPPAWAASFFGYMILSDVADDAVGRQADGGRGAGAGRTVQIQGAAMQVNQRLGQR
jgi:hypothetical protein